MKYIKVSEIEAGDVIVWRTLDADTDQLFSIDVEDISEEEIENGGNTFPYIILYGKKSKPPGFNRLTHPQELHPIFHRTDGGQPFAPTWTVLKVN